MEVSHLIIVRLIQIVVNTSFDCSNSIKAQIYQPVSVLL